MPSAPKWVFDAVDLLMSKLPAIKVTSTELLSPSVRKICFRGDFKKLDFPVGAYTDFRVSDTEARRYTVAYADTENGVLEFIVHLHGEGPGGHFMDSLQVGDTFNMNKPRGERRYYDKEAARFVIVGDETSLGLACSFLPVLQKNKQPFRFYFELAEENKQIPALLGLENSTVFAKDGSFSNEQWINDLPVLQSPAWQAAHFIVTGNVKSVQTFRKVLKNRIAGKIVSQGYWLEGKKGL